jgi:hypothetical protein
MKRMTKWYYKSHTGIQTGFTPNKRDKIKAIENNKISQEYEKRDFINSNLAKNCLELKSLPEMEMG